jgi:hypothetical protein
MTSQEPPFFHLSLSLSLSLSSITPLTRHNFCWGTVATIDTAIKPLAPSDKKSIVSLLLDDRLQPQLYTALLMAIQHGGVGLTTYMAHAGNGEVN